jgi:hypothetical protein
MSGKGVAKAFQSRSSSLLILGGMYNAGTNKKQASIN